MKIACIGWGSLIWNPGNLLIHRKWFEDGPLLPVEFLRKSNGGRLTLVLSNNIKPVRTLWSLMATEDLNIAIDSLREREGIPESKKIISIGVLKLTDEADNLVNSEIKHWAVNLKLDAVIWTNLPSNFKDDGNLPSKEEAISYLRSLDINKRQNAEEYIRKAPRQIDTEFRRFFEMEFGWTAI